MSFKNSLLISLLSVCGVNVAVAADPSYPTPGTQNGTWYKFVANTTGPLTAYFLGSKAAFEENIFVISNGRSLGATGLSNRHLRRGDPIIFGYVTAGDTVNIFLSIPEKNTGVFSQKFLIGDEPAFANGVYSVNYPGDVSSDIPAGVYVGFEDLAYDAPFADWDYNDSEYVFTNVTAVIDK